MYQYKCMNQIAQFGLNHFTEDYKQTENMEEADALLVRSAALHEVEFPENLKAIARAGAGVNNIPLTKCADQGIVVFNTPGPMPTALRSWYWQVCCWRQRYRGRRQLGAVRAYERGYQ